MMRFAKVRKVRTPERATEGSAGIDFFVPDDFKTVRLLSGEDYLIKSGIKVDVPNGYMLMAADKSGVVTSSNAKAEAKMVAKGANTCAILGAKIVDEDYQGEVFIHIINLGPSVFSIHAGQKIAQFILVPVGYHALVEVSESELFNEQTKRGEGCLGSTNK